jgi:protein required for attachment to host cells
MPSYCVVVADGARARFFTLKPAALPAFEGGPDLHEREDLVNPEKEQTSRELFSNLKTGRNRAAGGGPAHGYDDHRTQHEDEFERRFARRVASRIRDLSPVAHIVLVADPRLLGFLRAELAGKHANGTELRELGKDLSTLSPTEIHARLAAAGLLPERVAPRY